MVTDFEENPLAAAVIETGRRLFALVSAKTDKISKQLDAACAAAVGHGWFSELCPSKTAVGGVVLPSFAPKHNHPRAVTTKYDVILQDMPDEEDQPEQTAALDTAKSFAEEQGLEIKVPGQDEDNRPFLFSFPSYLLHPYWPLATY